MGAARVRLDPGQAEVADVARRRRIGQVEDLQDARRAPAVHGADQVGDAGVALPPVLVRVLVAGRCAACLDHRPHERRVRRIGDIPNLVTPVAVRPQQVEVTRPAARKLIAGAYLNHLRPAGPAGRRNVRQVDRRFRCGDVDHRRAVGLHRPRQRIERFAGVVADVEDPPRPLPHRQRLIGRAALQVVRPDEARVERLLAVPPASLLRRQRHAAGNQNRGNRPCQPAVHRQPPLERVPPTI